MSTKSHTMGYQHTKGGGHHTVRTAEAQPVSAKTKGGGPRTTGPNGTPRKK